MAVESESKFETARAEGAISSEHPIRVLLVDDDALMMSAMKRVFRGHVVTGCERVAEALQLMDEGARFDVIVSDLMMPEMTGADFYREVHRRSPEMAQRFVFVSGGGTTAETQEFLDTVRQPVFGKPFDRAELRQVVELIGRSKSSA